LPSLNWATFIKTNPPLSMARHSGTAEGWVQMVRENILSDKTGRIADVINMRIARGADRYQRKIHLPRLIPIPEHLLVKIDKEQANAIVTKLNCALRRERNRGKNGHWAYDLNRHLGLMQAYKSEMEGLKTSHLNGSVTRFSKENSK
jgi:hypothetical protein